jgi:uncharacterized protein involved in exopolysaccharide biosynthesis
MDGRGTATQNGQDRTAGEVGILDLMAVLVRQWRVIVLSLVAALAVGVAVLLLQPTRYVAQVVVVPAGHASSASTQLLGGQLSAGLLAQLSLGGSSDELIGAILESRTLRDSIAQRVAPDSLAADAIRTVVDKHAKTKTNDDGSIAITVKDTDPRRAAQIANAYPSIANLIASQLSAEAALRKHEFLRRELDDARERLYASEQRMTAFQRSKDLPEVQEQARRSIDVAATLQQRIMEQEMDIVQLERSATHDNPELQTARAELATLQNQLRQMTSDSGGNHVLLSLRSSPDLKAASARLLRQYSQDEQVYNMLMASYVQTQLDAQSDLPVLSVLDPALVPTGPDHSLWSIVAVLSVFAGFVVGVGGAVMREYLIRARSDPENATFFIALADLRRDVSHLLPGRARTRA